MHSNHLVTKGFDSGVNTNNSILIGGISIQINPTELREEVSKQEELVNFNISKENETSHSIGKDSLKSSPISSICIKNDEVLPLSMLYDYKVTPNSEMAKVGLPVGANFDVIFENEDVKDYMISLGRKMFPNVNPLTNKKDLERDAFYLPYIPLSVLTGVMTSQKDDKGNSYFNPDGTVSVAEFLDGLNAIKYGANANNHRKKTLDRISDENDYFNEGYQDCIRGISSPFFNLYMRKELLQPITRLELAYITVICWNQYINKFNTLYGGNYYLGISFDWENPYDVLSRFDDGFDYKVSKLTSKDEFNVISLNVKDYKREITMEQYKENIKNGSSAIPLPMFMSMLELFMSELFYFSDNRLDPMREVTRGELCYFLSKLAKEFPTKYI